MDLEPIIPAYDWPILDIPHRKIASVPGKELFPEIHVQVQAIIVLDLQLQALQVNFCKPDLDVSSKFHPNTMVS